MKWGRCGLVWQEVTKQERLMNNFTIVWNFCDCSDMWATRASLVLIFFEMIPLGSTAALVLRPQFITTEVQKQAGAVIFKLNLLVMVPVRTVFYIYRHARTQFPHRCPQSNTSYKISYRCRWAFYHKDHLFKERTLRSHRCWGHKLVYQIWCTWCYRLNTVTYRWDGYKCIYFFKCMFLAHLLKVYLVGAE